MDKKVTKLEKKLQGCRNDTKKFSEVLSELKENASDLESVQQQHTHRVIDCTLEHTSRFADIMASRLYFHQHLTTQQLFDKQKSHLQRLAELGVPPNMELLLYVQDHVRLSKNDTLYVEKIVEETRNDEIKLRQQSSNLEKENPNLNAVLKHADRIKKNSVDE